MRAGIFGNLVKVTEGEDYFFLTKEELRRYAARHGGDMTPDAEIPLDDEGYKKFAQIAVYHPIRRNEKSLW